MKTIARSLIITAAAAGIVGGAAGLANANPFINNSDWYVGDTISYERCAALAEAWGGECVYFAEDQYRLKKVG